MSLCSTMFPCTTFFTASQRTTLYFNMSPCTNLVLHNVTVLYHVSVYNSVLQHVTPHLSTADAEIKDSSVENPDLKGLFSKQRVGQNRTLHASHTVRDLFRDLISTFPVHSSSSFFFFFFLNLSRVFFFLCYRWLAQVLVSLA